MFGIKGNEMLLITLATDVILILFIFSVYLSSFRRIKRIQKKGVITSGTIVNTRHHSRHRSHNYATITFLTEDGTEITRKSPIIYSRSPYRVGQTVEVSYLPNKPHMFIFGHTGEYLGSVAGECFLISLLCVVCSIVTYFKAFF